MLSLQACDLWARFCGCFSALLLQWNNYQEMLSFSLTSVSFSVNEIPDLLVLYSLLCSLLVLQPSSHASQLLSHPPFLFFSKSSFPLFCFSIPPSIPPHGTPACVWIWRSDSSHSNLTQIKNWNLMVYGAIAVHVTAVTYWLCVEAHRRQAKKLAGLEFWSPTSITWLLHSQTSQDLRRPVWSSSLCIAALATMNRHSRTSC